nr:cytochrome p450 monooxygenase gsff [Quercus suber]
MCQDLDRNRFCACSASSASQDWKMIPAPSVLCHFSNSWFSARRHSKPETKLLQTAHHELGPIIRLGPHEVSVASSEGLRSVYTAGLDKHPWYVDEFINFDRTSLVSMVDHATHSAQKRVIANLYAKSYLLLSEDMAALSADILFRRYLPILGEAAARDQSVEVFELAQWTGLDAMTAYLFGLERGTNFLQDVQSRKHYFHGSGLGTQDATATKQRREAVCMAMCEETAKALTGAPGVAEGNASSRPVVFEKLYPHLLEITKQRGQPSQEALLQTASEMQDAMIASEETTAITITYILYHLSQTPALQTALHQELRTLSPLPTTALPSPAAIAALPLLDGIVAETLRLHAAVPARQPRVVPAPGITLHGYFLPAGTTVSSNAYTLHRDADVFPDAETWDPQRWLPQPATPSATDAERLKSQRRYLWAFGSGGRMCIGSNFALQNRRHLRQLRDGAAAGGLRRARRDAAVGCVHRATGGGSVDGEVPPEGMNVRMPIGGARLER